MLSFLGILKSPTTWKAVVVLVLVAFIGANYIRLTTTIKNLQGDKVSLEEGLKNCERNYNTEKIANIQNRQTIEIILFFKTNLLTILFSLFFEKIIS